MKNTDQNTNKNADQYSKMPSPPRLLLSGLARISFLQKFLISNLFSVSIIFIVTFLNFPTAHAQKKIDLEDLAIKGELHGDDRLTILARERLPLKNYVKFRTNFHTEILEALPEPAVGSKDRK